MFQSLRGRQQHDRVSAPETENHQQTGSQRNERWKIRPLSNVGLFQKTRENKKRHQKVEISKLQSVVRKVGLLEFYKKQDGKLKKSLKKEKRKSSYIIRDDVPDGK